MDVGVCTGAGVRAPIQTCTEAPTEAETVFHMATHTDAGTEGTDQKTAEKAEHEHQGTVQSFRDIPWPPNADSLILSSTFSRSYSLLRTLCLGSPPPTKPPGASLRLPQLPLHHEIWSMRNESV